MATVLITGGTGDLGSKLVERCVAGGNTVRVLSRRARPAEAATEWAQGDMETGEGLGKAVMGADLVMHAATGGGRGRRRMCRAHGTCSRRAKRRGLRIS